MKLFEKYGYCIAVTLALCSHAFAEKKAAQDSPAAKMEKIAYDLSESLTACKYALELDKSKREAMVMEKSRAYMKAHNTLSVPDAVQTRLEQEAATQLRAGGSKFEACRTNEKRDNLKDLKDITARFGPKYADGIHKMQALWLKALDAIGTQASSQARLDFTRQADTLVASMKN